AGRATNSRRSAPSPARMVRSSSRTAAGAEGPASSPGAVHMRFSLWSQLSDESSDTIHGGVDDGEQPVPDPGKGDRLRPWQPADRRFEQLETGEGVRFAR